MSLKSIKKKCRKFIYNKYTRITIYLSTIAIVLIFKLPLFLALPFVVPFMYYELLAYTYHDRIKFKKWYEEFSKSLEEDLAKYKQENENEKIYKIESITRNPNEIVKEKTEFVGLLELLEKYQALETKNEPKSYTPVPTIEIDQGYSYLRK